ncbi:MAG: fibronectin type III domain-containing protein [Phaeodactylibacter sp.]|nr:fibronectin type III domain-containing protein [Phaeodactylibacter sp.]
MKKLNLTFLLMALILGLAPKSWAQCTTPTGLEAANITTNSANLSWEAVQGAIKYAIKIQNGANTPTYEVSVIIGDTRLEALGLAPDGTYQFKVQAWCRTGGGSEYSDWLEFRTPAGSSPMSCTAPTRLTASDITSFTATLSWDAVPDALKYEIEVSDGARYFVNDFPGQTSYSASRLAPKTDYRFRVRSWCSNGTGSAFSDWTDFTTKPLGAFRTQSPSGNPFHAYPNPASQTLNLTFPAVTDGAQLELKAYNAQGQLYRTISFPAYKGQAQEVNVADWPDGMYFLTTEGKGLDSVPQKIMVSHQ